MPIVKSFHRFNPNSDFTPEQAAELARQINDYELRIPDTKGARLYLSQGWAFDIGNKPYLIDYGTSIVRKWARGIGALRRSLALSRDERVVADPFEKGGS